MSYSATTIRSIVEGINREFYLPAIQRPFVWEPDQIVALFDSLMKGYPISSFLFWEIKPENRQNWDIYKFIENFRYGSTHNDLVEPDGRDITLVLDGQQRLTSLLIGLRGSYTVKLKHKRWDNPSAWVKQRLFLDLLQDGLAGDDSNDLGVTYGFQFFEAPPKSGAQRYWFKVGRILDFDDEDTFDRFKDQVVDELPGTLTRDQERICRRNLERLYRTIWKDEVIAFYTEKNQSYDRVLDIFIRANDGGTKLSKSDLLLSMITSKWDGVNAREAIYSFVDHINDDVDRKNNFDKDFVMRACLVVSGLDHRYRVENFTNKSLSIIESRWEDIKSSIEGAVRLVNRFGIDRDTLTSANALMPVIYYLSKVRRGSLDGSTPFEIENALAIKRWLIGALLNNVFGGNSDATIGASRSIVDDALRENHAFPYAALVDGLRRRGRVSDFSGDSLDDVLDTRYGQRTCFLALSLLYDSHNWGSTYYHIDHVIPRSLCDPRKLRARGVSEARISSIVGAVDRLGNLQLLLGRENTEKSNRPFEEWIQTRSADFLDQHLIPRDQELWRPENLADFVKAREVIIRRKIQIATGVGDALRSTMGKS